MSEETTRRGGLNLGPPVPDFEVLSARPHMPPILFVFTDKSNKVLSLNKTCRMFIEQSNVFCSNGPTRLFLRSNFFTLFAFENAIKPCNDYIFISYQRRGQSKVIISPCNLLVKNYNKNIQFKLNKYRPVSVLSAFSKILERIVSNHLIDFLNKFNILSNNQYGFRKNHCTAYALIQLYDKLSNAIDQGKVTLGLLIDLSKAFNTVNHDIFLAKLEFCGVCGVALQWFKSHLSRRTQFVQYNGSYSSSKWIKGAVPQGSTLGPLLVSLYINDLCNVSQALDFILFADDANLFFPHIDPIQLMEIVNNELKKLSSSPVKLWFSIKLIATEFFSTPLNCCLAI